MSELITFGAVWILGAVLALTYALGAKPPGILSLLMMLVRPAAEAFFGPVD